MYVSRARIQNFKAFRDFTLPLQEGLNVIAGNNDAGKSTLLEALHLVLAASYRGRTIGTAISEDLFNRACIEEFFQGIRRGQRPDPPRIAIEVVFGGEGSLVAEYQGDQNIPHAKESGMGIAIELNTDEYEEDFWNYVALKGVEELPVEYYRFVRYRFDRSPVYQRRVPIRSSLIDSSGQQAHFGSKAYVSKSAREVLPRENLIAIAQSHRKARSSFNADENVVMANEVMGRKVQSLTGKSVSFAAAKGTKDAWESAIDTHLDGIPLFNAGAGSQSIVAIELALRKVDGSRDNLVLLEEPEGHLSHSRLNMLLRDLIGRTQANQIVVSTHSSFVANKLMLNRLAWIEGNSTKCLTDLKEETARFFSKAAGYDTLRLLFCKAAILVEGDSDELVVQKVYMNRHDGRLPIQDGIEVISVGTSFLRFFELAKLMGKTVVAITDNDGDLEAVREKYADYLVLDDDAPVPSNSPIASESIAASFPTRILAKGAIENYSYNMLEPELFEANGLEAINRILGKSYGDRDTALRFMKSNKVESAMRFFDYEGSFAVPPYIVSALQFIEGCCHDGKE